MNFMKCNEDTIQYTISINITHVIYNHTIVIHHTIVI